MVARVDIMYGGRLYTAGRRTLEEVRADVAAALAAGSGWLEANDGEGEPQTAYLLIAPGVDLALLPVDAHPS